MWISQCFSQHLLNISHDGHLLMSSQRVLYPFRRGGTLEGVKKVIVNQIETCQLETDNKTDNQVSDCWD